MSSSMGAEIAGSIRWTVDPTPEELDGFERVDWLALRDERPDSQGWIALARGAGMQRSSLASPAKAWFDWFGTGAPLAVLGVELDGPGAVEDLLGFVVEPAARHGIDLVIGADRPLPDIDDPAFVEPELGYAHALERLHWRIDAIRAYRAERAVLPQTSFRPDAKQAEAVNADDGVVQIIAPAGSGKSTVLVERVRELRRRGIPGAAIACVTFNRAAARELSERLAAAGVGDVSALTFHGLGHRILRKAGILTQETTIGQPTLAQWRRLAARARNAVGKDGVFLDPGEASEAISAIKLGLLMTARPYAELVRDHEHPRTRTIVELYRLYEEHMRLEQKLDFDDLILRAVCLLRDDAEARGMWQHTFEQLLVDEYQDIEPAQETLVRIVAAPHDQLFCVGDEDQTLYVFRRASVERIICLDAQYPSLHRIALERNYRCPRRIVEASAKLIAVNRVRFPKPILHGGAPEDHGVITLRPVRKQLETAADIAQTLAAHRRGEVVVLARTTDALRPVALACADRGIAIDGPDKLFTPNGARLALQQHLQLLTRPSEATEALIAAVCRTPGRGLAKGQARTIAARLNAGISFMEAFAEVEAPRRARGTLLAPGPLFEQLGAQRDAGGVLALLRGPGGLEDWFGQEDSMGGIEQFECEILETAQRDAAGLRPDVYLQQLEHQAGALAAIRHRQHGIELATIHGSKGRQWKHVIVVACDEGALPHAQSLKVSAEARRRGEGLEAERRLAYVAFTRAQEILELHHDPERPSRFIAEAGIRARPPRFRPPSPAAAPPPMPPMQPRTTPPRSKRPATRPATRPVHREAPRRQDLEEHDDRPLQPTAGSPRSGEPNTFLARLKRLFGGG